MVSGATSDTSDLRVNSRSVSLQHLKIFSTQHKFKPGDAASWQNFNGEFKSGLDADALPALTRAKRYTLLECYEMLSPKNRTEEAAAELCARLNELYDQASDYIYRCLYANIDFSVVSHGPALQATVERSYATERDGPGFYQLGPPPPRKPQPVRKKALYIN